MENSQFMFSSITGFGIIQNILYKILICKVNSRENQVVPYLDFSLESTYPKNLRAIIELIFECIIFLQTPFNLFKNRKKRTQELLHRLDKKKKKRVWYFLTDDLTTMTHLTGDMQNRCCLEEES